MVVKKSHTFINYIYLQVKARKWKMGAFYYVLDTIRIHSITMMALKSKEDPRKQNSFDIGFELAKPLIVPRIMRRPKVGINKTKLTKMSLIVGEEVGYVLNNVPPLPKQVSRGVNVDSV